MTFSYWQRGDMLVIMAASMITSCKVKRLSRMIWIIPPESRIFNLGYRQQDPGVWRGLVEFLDSRGRTLLQVSSPRNISNKCMIYGADHTKYDVKHHLNK